METGPVVWQAMGVVLPGLSTDQEMSDQGVASLPCCSMVVPRRAERLAFIVWPEKHLPGARGGDPRLIFFVTIPVETGP